MRHFMEESVGNVLTEAGTGLTIPLTMQRLDLVGRVTPVGAMLRVTHRFKTEGQIEPMEALYTFMLPRNGTLRRFIVKGENFKVESKLEPRAEAREAYEEGMEAGHLSVLAEANQDGMVSLSVGQVQPDEIITVVMDIVSGVEIKDNIYRFRFPFTLAPSYHARAIVTSTKDDGKMTLPSDVFGDIILPEWKNDASGLHRVSFRMNVEAAGKLDSVSSPSHRILVRPSGEGSAEIELSGTGDVPNRDLVIDVQAKEVEASVFADAKLVSKKSSKDDPKVMKGASRWTVVVPSSLLPKSKKVSRKVCFVLDDSGSMGGQPIEQAKLAVRACLSALRPTDEFGLIYFGSSYTVFDAKMAKATDVSRKRADQFISRIHAGSGGTNLADALGAAISVLGGSGGDIFLMTDGQVFETGTIVEQCAAAGAKVHVLGIGSASQDRFLSSLARRSHGVQKMVGVTEDVTASSLELFNAVRRPIQIDLKAYVTGKKMSQEHQVDTIWDGYPVLLTDDGTTGLNLPQTVTFTWGCGKSVKKVKVPVNCIQEVPNGLSGLLHAGRQVEDLEAALDAALKDGPEKKNIEALLKVVSISYGLASRLMSLIAIVKRAGDQAGTQVKQQVVAVGIPEGMGGAGIFRGCGGQSFSSYVPVSSCVSESILNYGASESILSYGASESILSYSASMDGMGQEPVEASSLRGFQMKGVCDFAVTDTDDIVDNPSELFGSLTKLQSDGGLPGETRKKRAHETVILALAAYMSDKDSDAPKYNLHIERMLEFLNHYLDLNVGKDPDMAKMVGIIEVGLVRVNEECMQILRNPLAGDPETNWVRLSSVLV